MKDPEPAVLLLARGVDRPIAVLADVAQPATGGLGDSMKSIEIKGSALSAFKPYSRPAAGGHALPGRKPLLLDLNEPASLSDADEPAVSMTASEQSDTARLDTDDMLKPVNDGILKTPPRQGHSPLSESPEAQSASQSGSQHEEARSSWPIWSSKKPRSDRPRKDPSALEDSDVDWTPSPRTQTEEQAQVTSSKRRGTAASSSVPVAAPDASAAKAGQAKASKDWRRKPRGSWATGREPQNDKERFQQKRSFDLRRSRFKRRLGYVPEEIIAATTPSRRTLKRWPEAEMRKVVNEYKYKLIRKQKRSRS